MTVTLDIEAEIRRLHFGEHWPVGTVVSQTQQHGDVVRRVLGLDTPRPSPTERLLLVEPYKDFIAETLKKYPTLRATRLFDMVKPRGYAGEVRTLRSYVATVRPKPAREAYLRISTLPGEQAQVDWAHVGKVRVQGGERPLWAFVMVLSWSRAMWGEFIFDLTAHSLRRSLARAAAYFGGNTRQWLFDNPKTVVLERHGDAVRFHPRLLDVSSHYCVSLRLCAVRKPNQKGRVERAIRYVRERFLEGRELRSVAQANTEFLAFLNDVANPRPHPTLPNLTVADCLAQEKLRLLKLPDVPLALEEVLPVTVDKTAFIRFDTNDYSVPHEYAQSDDNTLTVAADDITVRVLNGEVEVARHARCWGRRQCIEDLSHREGLLAQKRGASEAKGQERLRALAPNVDILFARWVETGRNVGSLTARLTGLLRSYDDDTVAAAVSAVIARGTTTSVQSPSSASNCGARPTSPCRSTWRWAATCRTGTSFLIRWRATMENQNEVFEELRRLGFRAPEAPMRALIQQLTKSRASPMETCEKFVALEWRERESKNLARRTRLATLGNYKLLDAFDWNHPKSIDRGLYEELHGLDFIEKGENVLLRGTSGLGKTMLAQNLGLAALTKGRTVLFTTLSWALADLLKQESIPAFERRLRRYLTPELLILDEIGYVPCDSRSADLLYNIISRRHERRSTVISTNLPFKQWGTIFPGAASVVALVDRFVQHCHVLDIEGESWRQKEPVAPSKKSPKPKR